MLNKRYYIAIIAAVTALGCIGCCSLPFLAVVFGSGTLALVATYNNTYVLAMFFFTIFMVLFVRFLLRSKKRCHVDCYCKNQKTL